MLFGEKLSSSSFRGNGRYYELFPRAPLNMPCRGKRGKSITVCGLVSLTLILIEWLSWKWCTCFSSFFQQKNRSHHHRRPREWVNIKNVSSRFTHMLRVGVAKSERNGLACKKVRDGCVSLQLSQFFFYFLLGQILSELVKMVRYKKTTSANSCLATYRMYHLLWCEKKYNLKFSLLPSKKRSCAGCFPLLLKNIATFSTFLKVLFKAGMGEINGENNLRIFYICVILLLQNLNSWVFSCWKE